MREDVVEALEEIRGKLELLESSLPHRIDAASASGQAKLPFHVIQCREALGWRCAELVRDGYGSIRRDRLAAGMLLTRAVLETVGAVWYLRAKVRAALRTGQLADVKTCVSRMLLGSRTDSEMPQAINVLNFLDEASKEVEEVREHYDRLCEVAHPNWAGTSLLFSRPDQEARAVDFGRNIRGSESMRVSAVMNLSAALLLFEVAYNGMADLADAFVALCDEPLSDAV